MKIQTITSWALKLMIATVLIIVVSACSSDSSSSSNSTDNTGDNSAENDGDVHTVKIAYGQQPDEAIGQMAEKWRELADEKSDGELELKLYPSSQLGDEADVIDQAISGDSVITIAGYDYLMNYVPDAGILTAPYIVDSIEEMLNLMETDWYEALNEELSDEGIEVINNTPLGIRHLMTDTEITTPEYLKGKKIRVPENKMSIETLNAMGGSATPTPLGDLYTSLQQGLVDGAENPLPSLNATKTQEVTDHLTLTGHQTFVVAWIGGSDYIDSIPEDLLDILKETGEEASEYGKEVLEEQESELLNEFEEEGIEIHEIDTEPFKEATKDVNEEFSDMTPDLYEKVQELVDSE